VSNSNPVRHNNPVTKIEFVTGDAHVYYEQIDEPYYLVVRLDKGKLAGTIELNEGLGTDRFYGRVDGTITNVIKVTE